MREKVAEKTNENGVLKTPAQKGKKLSREESESGLNEFFGASGSLVELLASRTDVMGIRFKLLRILACFLFFVATDIQCHQENHNTTDRIGLRSRRPLRRLPLTPHHRQCRLDFCRPRATWSVTDWRRVIFSDESRFSLSADDHRTCLEAHQPAVRSDIVERHTAISQGVTVWGAISWDTRSSLVVLQGTLTARRYVDDILTPIVLPMLSNAIYQQDNARPHTARLSQQCLQGYDVPPGHQIFRQ
ncbi:HTH_Tnp_Tc3_2 domain-containing protein [Trichonephila clavipes]|nr:HTH_Tnp_Tc3_2 domain-containing protein [Trichonephila clavipes]